MNGSTILIACIGGVAALLQGVVLFVLKGIREDLGKLVSKETCEATHKHVDFRLTRAEHELDLSKVGQP